MFTTQADVKVKDFPEFVETLIEQFKSEKFRAGFIKLNKEKRVGNFDLLYRVRWKQSDGNMYKRKGKPRTTDEDEYLLAFDLDIKDGYKWRNIPLNHRLKYLMIGKKCLKISYLHDKYKFLIEYPRVTFDFKKALLNKNWEDWEVQ